MADRSLDERAEAIKAQTEALEALKAEMENNRAATERINAITAKQATRELADMISGELGPKLQVERQAEATTQPQRRGRWADRFEKAGNWFEDAVWAEGRPNLPRPFHACAVLLWSIEKRLRRP